MGPGSFALARGLRSAVVLGERARRDTAIALIGLMVGLAIALAVVLMNDGGPGNGTPRAASAADDVMLPTDDRDGDVIVFLEHDITPEQSTAIEQVLASSPRVAQFEYWDHAMSHEEALQLFRDNPEMLAKLQASPELVPASYRVTLVEDDIPSATELILALDGVAGVLQTVSTL